METRIQSKIDNQQHTFKVSLQEWIVSRKAIMVDKDGNDLTLDFLQTLFDFEGLILQKEDFQRRKRVKNQVPKTERCCAKRANGEQCTRRKLDNQFCGTHKKGAPHGIIIESELETNSTIDKVEIWMQDFGGINYFVDKGQNVYSPEDIVANKTNPTIIGKWSSVLTVNGETLYSLNLFE